MSGPRTARSVDFLARKAEELAAREALPEPALAALRTAAGAVPAAPSFARALRSGPHVSVIAEFKRRSPSAGRLVDDRPGDVAAAYADAGAAAVSVLTDRTDFGGSLDDLRAAAGRLPALRKDFVVDEAGVLEARVAGAAAVLLIVALLDGQSLRRLIDVAREGALEPMVEAHDERELEVALEAGATVIGINNRDLRTLRTDLAVTECLASRLPPDVIAVSESGIRDAGDVARVRDAGAHAVLVGESLLRLRGAARTRLLRELASVPRASALRVGAGSRGR